MFYTSKAVAFGKKTETTQLSPNLFYS